MSHDVHTHTFVSCDNNLILIVTTTWALCTTCGTIVLIPAKITPSFTQAAIYLAASMEYVIFHRHVLIHHQHNTNMLRRKRGCRRITTMCTCSLNGRLSVCSWIGCVSVGGRFLSFLRMKIRKKMRECQ